MNLDSIIKQVKSSVGFTLIEIMLVIAIIGVVGSVSILSFADYNKSQIIQTTAGDLASVLNLAKSRAQTQTGVSLCVNPLEDVLKGYSVTIHTSGSDKDTYEVSAICSSSSDLAVCSGSSYATQIASGKLPQDVSFVAPTTTSFCFPTLVGGVKASGTVTLSGFGRTKQVIVDTAGGIRVQ